MAAASTAAATTAAISATGVSTEIGRVNMATKEAAPTIRTVAPNLKRLSRNTLVRPLAFRNHTSKLIRCGAIGADKLTQVEMSIPHTPAPLTLGNMRANGVRTLAAWCLSRGCNCLLYTSDAADDLLCVDLGARRILKT